ncbi:hypothetical protein CANARDRAFT_29675 [[Candida] arabinofermentans NRRL YB-2248]|uniref:Presequence protease, mitochondrial n=1 Tax=[Candida] arabinofermentans NRRL YB-2248 TaxID=983967 RepID=A0A1E4SW41_9ASCO|nr:hypothetical protein CANARDRAFT_29675 [[Candida] arabinofermentans NRRL YB-2248]
MMLASKYRPLKVNLMARNLATAIDQKLIKKYPIGKEVHGYVINRVHPVPQFNLTAVDLTHTRTGSQHLHIDRQDKNNAFSIIFKTNPPNSTGLPHILEHTTLCGSEKYPVRDPFFKMLNRSLSNFMNAMTGHDYTFYPFSTTNKADFSNLLDVYLDSTLNPLLKEEDFYQEGWRLESENTEDKNSPLSFKGVVYNEMKGQMSDSSYFFWIKFQESIYPSLNNSGGDPTKMTDLVYEDLVEFHERYYHPSNSRTFTYGDIPLERHLEKINQELIKFGKRHKKNDIKKPIALDKIIHTIAPGPVDPMLPEDKQIKSSLTWYTGSPMDIYGTFLMRVLSTLLMDGHSSPLYQELIESGYATDFSINAGMESMTSVNLFTVGCQGLSESSAKDLETKVLAALNKAKETGFSDQKVKAIIHQLELSRKIENASFGLGLLNSLVPSWVNNVDPMDSLKWDEIVTQFNDDYKFKGDSLFTELMDKYILSSPYFKYTMQPDATLEASVVEEEQSRLKAKVETLTDDDKEILHQRGLQLLEKQNEKEDVSCLPTLSVSDINRDGESVRVDTKSFSGTELQTRLSPKTNGLTYFRALKTLTADSLPLDLVKYLPLFSDCLTNLGTKSKSMATIEDEIKLYTGGLNSSTFVHASPNDPSQVYLKFALGGLSLDSNFEKMLQLWKELLNETDFRNIPKLSTLIKSLSNDNLSDVVSSGHNYARSYATSKLSPVSEIQETLGGIEQVQFLGQLAKFDAEGSLETNVVPHLERIKDVILSGSKFQVGLTCGRGIAKMQETELSGFLNSFTSTNDYSLETYRVPEAKPSSLTNLIEIPSQVSFSSSAYNGASYSSPDSASLQILSQLLTFKYLHSEVREKGGAYGGGATYDSLGGLFSYYSYRDPKPFQSLKTFSNSVDNIVERIAQGDIGEADLEQAKLTIFQRLDAPISVRSEGMGLFNYGIDDDMKQERREALLDCDLDDVVNVSEKYFTGTSKKSDVIIGNFNDSETKEWNVIKL